MQQGELFAGRYLVEETLGKGGMGVVYRVLDQRLHRQAALKVMNPDLSQDPTFRERFEREAKAGAHFEHPNVVTVHHYDEDDAGTLYLVTQYVDGVNLHRALDEGGPFPLTRTVEVVSQLAAGLDAAHRNGHVHRDVKPGNVLLAHDGRVLLTDFGLAQSLGASDDRLTSTGTMLGTATYGSPEQFRGEAATVRSDVYSLACVAFEMLTGRPPFRGATDVETAGHHLSQPAPDAATFAPGLPAAVGAVLSRGLAKNPYDRPVTAGAFADDLAQAAASTPGPTTAELQVEPVARRGHGRAFAIAGAVVALAFGVGLAGGLLSGPGDGGATPSSTPSDDRYAALAKRLPTAVFTGCAPQPEREGAGRPTSLRCTTPLAGVDELLVTQWESPAAMTADYTKAYGGKPDGKCGSYTGQPPSGLRSTWGGGQGLACYLNTNRAAVVMWEYTDKAVQVLAVRADGNAQAAFAWWRTAVASPVT